MSDLGVTVIGTGYLGATHAVCLAERGFQVVGVDVDPDRIAQLSAGDPPFHEPLFREALRANLAAGRLRFTVSVEEAAAFGDVHFLCVGTPQADQARSADLSHLNAAVAGLAPLLTRRCLVVGKSTVPVGTAARLAGHLRRSAPAGDQVVMAWNPEFLREGQAVADSLHPDRIIAGLPDELAAAVWAEEVLRRIYAAQIAEGTSFICADYATAELAKVAANAFLATKISFVNAMAEVCEAAGGDVVTLSQTLACDERIGEAFLAPGLGFGGGCLPKDIRAFQARAEELGAEQALRFLDEVDQINQRCRSRVVEMAQIAVGGSLVERRVGVWGASFKPGSDDVRDSPALAVAEELRQRGAVVTVYDPHAMGNARTVCPSLSFASSAWAAAQDAQVVLLLTEWDEFRNIAPRSVANVVASPVIIDARNALPPESWHAAGWTVHAPGRRIGQRQHTDVTQNGSAPQKARRLVQPTCVQVGFGASARIHRNALGRLGIPVIGVLETRASRRAEITAAGLTACPTYQHAAELRPDFWEICTPTSTHADVIAHIISVDPDANLLVEKPLCAEADLPRVLELLSQHRGAIVVNENYCSSAIPGLVARHVRDLGITPEHLIIEMTKNRTADIAAGRFLDTTLGAFGYEGTHLIAVLEQFGAAYLTGVLEHAGTSALTVPVAEAELTLPHQGTAFVDYRTADNCLVSLHTSMNGVIGYPCAHYRTGEIIQDPDGRHRILQVQGTGKDGAAYQITGFFEPLPGHRRGHAAVTIRKDGTMIGPEQTLTDDTVVAHLSRALHHFRNGGENPCSLERSVTHLKILQPWAQQARSATDQPPASTLTTTAT